MATGTAGTAARSSHNQMLHYMRKEIAYNTTGISSGVAFKNPLPSGAEIMFTKVNVTTAFNAGTTNVLTVGTNSSDFDNLVGSGDVDESTAEGQYIFTGGDVELAADTTVYIKYTQTGSAASTGAAIVTIVYAVDNDE